MGKNNESRLVYSSDGGRLCPGCGQPQGGCSCRQAAATAAAGPVRVRLETKGRKGKGVTVVTGLPLAAADLADLGKQLKQKCGAGGTVKEGAIEIQGDHRPAVIAALQALGHKPRG